MGVCETTPTTFEPTGTPDTATPTEPTPTTKQSQPGSTTNHATGPAPHAPKPALDNQDPHGCRSPQDRHNGPGSAVPSAPPPARLGLARPDGTTPVPVRRCRVRGYDLGA